eukprot:1142841-Pelagomonas_calceolata.AAC.2
MIKSPCTCSLRHPYPCTGPGSQHNASLLPHAHAPKGCASRGGFQRRGGGNECAAGCDEGRSVCCLGGQADKGRRQCEWGMSVAWKRRRVTKGAGNRYGTCLPGIFCGCMLQISLAFPSQHWEVPLM